MKIYKYILFFIGLVLIDSVNAQTDSIKVPFAKVVEHGFLMGYGYGIDYKNVTEGNYRPIFLMYRNTLKFPRIKEHPSGKLKFRIYAEYQINPVMVQDGDNTMWSCEFGISNGIQANYKLNSQLEIFTLIGSGPHFMAFKTERQTRGFIFSDNMDAGLSYYFTKNWKLNFHYRIRHMSNANLWMPNHGVNTTNFLIGMSKILN